MPVSPRIKYLKIYASVLICKILCRQWSYLCQKINELLFALVRNYTEHCHNLSFFVMSHVARNIELFNKISQYFSSFLRSKKPESK
jgi:hypothetical protein